MTARAVRETFLSGGSFMRFLIEFYRQSELKRIRRETKSYRFYFFIPTNFVGLLDNEKAVCYTRREIYINNL